METSFEEIIFAVNPIDFVGRAEETDAFYQMLKDLLSDQPTVRWVHISGVAGSGKSSFLNKLKDIALNQDILTFSIEVPIAPIGMRNFFIDMKEQINNLSPEWRNLIQRKRGIGIGDIPEELAKKSFAETISSDVADQFISAYFQILDKANEKLREERKYIGVFIDDLERILNFEYLSVFEILRRIFVETNKRNMNIFYVTAGHSSVNQFLKISSMEQQGFVLHMQMDSFDFKDADLMVRRRGKLIKTEREKVLSSSTRLPFDLALRQFLASKGFDEIKLDGQTIAKAFGMTEEEVVVLEFLSKYDTNLFQRVDIIKHFSKEVLDSLVDGFILTRAGEYYAFITQSVWELISHAFLPIDPRTEVLLLLNRIERLATSGMLPMVEDIEIITKNVNRITDQHLIFRLSTELAKTAEVALDNQLVDVAWELLLIAEKGLIKTSDYERLGDLFESLSRNFAAMKRDYLAAKGYQKSAEYFEMAKIEWRAHANYREAARRFRRQAEQMNLSLFHYAARSLYQRSINAFLKAGERKSALEVKEMAVGVFENHLAHKHFFEQLTINA